MITISPGHWKVGTGAKGFIDEVTEARRVVKRVVQLLKKYKITTNVVEDNVSKNQQQNLNYLVSNHNKTKRKLDVSVHFNAAATSRTGKGTEVLYYSEKVLATKLSKSISGASGLRDRGAKERKELAFLANTDKPAILIEVCFVSDSTDVEIYQRDFEKICQAIAKTLAEHVGYKLDTTQFYIVASGDTLYGIAKTNNTTVDKLKIINNLKSDILSVGSKLRVK